MSSQLAPKFSDTDTAQGPEKTEGHFCPPFRALSGKLSALMSSGEKLPTPALFLRPSLRRCWRD